MIQRIINTVEQSSAANIDLAASGFLTGIENVVYTTGNQVINGNKVFLDNLVINNLTVTGTETIVNTDTVNIGNNYLLLNVTGGEGMFHTPASDGGIFFVTGEGLTGINHTGAILGYDSPAGKWVFGIGSRNSDLQNLNEIASVSYVSGLSGYVNSKTTNLIYTSGNQIKSGRLIIGNDANSIVDPNSQYTLSLQTNSPSTWLEILNNSGAGKGVFFGIQDNDFEQYSYQGGDIRFFTSETPGDGTERLIIKNDGKVGIDTHSPSEKLEVAGNIKVTNSGFFASGIKVGNNSIYITENSIDGGYIISNTSSVDGLLGIQYSGYFNNDPTWFTTASVKPIINELTLTGVSASGTYTRVSDSLNQGTSYFQGPSGWRINYYSQYPSSESYWYLNPENFVQHYTSPDLESWALGQAIQNWDGGGTYNINDIVIYGGSVWICKAYAPAGYGPFGGYLDGSLNGTDYWDELPATQASTITQTQNSENSIIFNVNRALSNGTSWEWVGYFKANNTSNHNFSINADRDAYFWIGDKALTGYTTGNADMYSTENNGSTLTDLPLTSGVSYPVRMQWGHPINPTNLGLALSYSNGIQGTTYNFSGLFFNASSQVQNGFAIDKISGDAYFAGNIQSNTATFNSLPTVSGSPLLTGVNLSAYITNGQTGAFYGASNPSGFTTASQLATGLTGVVQLAIGYSMSSANAAVSGFADSLSGTLSGILSGYVKTGETGAFYSTNNPSGFITGVSQFNFNNGGDITGSLLSPRVTKIQGNPVSNQVPADGQTLQWNGTAWVPGAIPAGGNGGGGLAYYFNFLNTGTIQPTGGLNYSGVYPLSLLGRDYSVGSGSGQSPDLTPQGVNQLVFGFISASGNPGVTNIPAGLWDFNIWASTDSNNASQTAISATVNIYNPITSGFRYLAQSDDVFLYDGTTPAQYLLNVTVPQTGIQANERIYIQIFAKKNVATSRTVTLYFDSYRPSHVHTTLPAVAGDGVVKVINGVLQTPATGIFDSDVDANAQIQQSKIQNLPTSLANLYPRNNPSGYITGVDLSSYVTNSQTGQFVSTSQSGAFYPRTNPSGFIPTISGTGVSNGGNVITGNYSVASIVYLTQSQYNAITPDGRTLYLVV